MDFLSKIKKVFFDYMLDTEDMSREEKRKQRKRREQLQACAVLGGGVLAVILVLVIIVNIATGGKHDNPTKQELQASKANAQTEKAQEEAEGEDGEQKISAAEQVAAATAKEEEEQAQKETEPDMDAILDQAIGEYIDGMTLEEKAASLFFVEPEQLISVKQLVNAGGMTSDAIAKYPVGGFIFSEKNIENSEQFMEMISNLHTYCRYETFMGIVDEGGDKSLFYKKQLIEEPVMSQYDIGQSGGVAQAYSAGISFGTQMRSYGLNVNFAPLADVTLEKNSTIAKRSFGENVEDVASLAKNSMKGMMDQSVHSVVKYFPSYGDVRGDGSSGKVSSKRTKDDLEKTEFEIYKQLIDAEAEMFMVSVVSMPEVTGDNMPACFSSVIVNDLLRGELGFEGVILTDYVSKSAISKSYKQHDIAVMALQAGCDMIVSPTNFKQQLQGILDAVEDGTLTEERLEESIYRIYRVKYKNLINYDNYIENQE